MVPLIYFLFGIIAPTAVSVLYSEVLELRNDSRQILIQSETSKLQLFSVNQTPCESHYVFHDLPFLNNSHTFIGREDEMLKVINMLNTVHIVGIHGAPGFGKSVLAIHIGYKMIDQRARVRYVDAIDKFSHLVSKEYAESFSTNDNDKQQVVSSEMQMYGKHSLAISGVQEFNEMGDTAVRELLAWSKSIYCHSILILDNCNEILSNQKTKQTFITLVEKMVLNSHGNLSVIITSRQKLIFLDDFDSLVVSDLSKNASLELLFKLAPNITTEDAEFVFASVEGCPLALKVVGRVLHSHGDIFSQLLRDELQTNLMRFLDQASSQKERFQVIMNLVFDHLANLKGCAYYVSLMPGSFDYEAGSNIIPYSMECIQGLLEQSLLEQYNFANQSRYKMHKLIREYLKHKGNSTTISRVYFNSIISNFEEVFCSYFTQYIVHYANKVRDHIVSEFDEFQYMSESHNIHYLLQILLSRTDHLTTPELKALAFAIDQNLISINEIIKSQLFYLLIGEVRNVCDVLNSETCGKLFSQIIQRLYKECSCKTVMEYFRQMINMQVPCMDLFQCQTVLQINEHEEVLLQLPKLEKAFISRLSRLHCGTEYRVYHYLFTPMHAISFCMFSYITLVYWTLAEGIRAGGVLDLMCEPAPILYPLIHFIYYTSFKRSDEKMVWMTVYFPALVQILFKLILYLVSIFFRIICGSSLNRLIYYRYRILFLAISLGLSCFEVFIFWNLVPYCY